MSNLFLQSDTALCSLVDYIRTFTEHDDENNNLFQLPPIQRNSVWNVAQIERLWDSLLRGYPIGSFLVSPRHEKDKARDFTTGVQKESTSSGYFLLDGQQRTRALLLGFQPNENARLWIDLDPCIRFGNIEFNDRKFLLRVLTSYQPWGMSDRNPSDKLPQHEKIDARRTLMVENIHYDYQVQLDTKTPIERSSLFSWPVKAKLPIPFDALMQLCGGTSGTFSRPEWNSVLAIVSIGCRASINYIDPPSHYYQVLNAIEKLISTKRSTVKTRTVVLLLQDEQHIEENQSEVQDGMEVLFRRINSGGTELKGEEMAYSLLKASWDGAYDMVSSIVRNPKVGYLMSSTGIVMAATRWARFLQGERDVPNPGIGNFRKWIGDKNDSSGLLQIMKDLLNVDEKGQSRYQKILQAFCEIVLYKDQPLGDDGLPKKLLLSIKPSIFHPVIIWIDKVECQNNILCANRKAILRYLIYCLLTVDEHEKMSKVVVEIIKNANNNEFPEKIIYQTLLEKKLSVPLPNPEEYAKPFNRPVDGSLREWKDAFDIDADPFNNFRSWFWHNKVILLWFQREYAAKWFEGYDPASDDAYDSPYDWDHIVPYSHLIGQGGYDFGQISKESLNRLWNARYRYINSIGNLRLWPYWANRSDNNRCHTEKLRMKDHEDFNDPEAKTLQLTSTDDFLRASAIPIEDRGLWLASAGKPRNWPDERRRSWQTAVEKRACFLFKELYDTFNFQAFEATIANPTSIKN